MMRRRPNAPWYAIRTGKIVGPHLNTTDPGPLGFSLNIQSVSKLIVRYPPQDALPARAYLSQYKLP
jgi:hypothetical protein